MTTVATTGPRTKQLEGLGECAVFRVSSHRARERMHRLLGFVPREFYSFWREDHYHAIPACSVAKLKAAKIPGVTQSRWFDDLRGCIPSAPRTWGPNLTKPRSYDSANV